MSGRRRESNSPALLPPRIQQRRAPAIPLSDQYKGYVPKGEGPARESIENLSREKLWQDYISCRKPVVIDGLIQQDNWHGEQWKDPSFLRKIAGSTLVKIEPVDAIRDQFGTSAKRKTVQLSTFLDILEDPELAGKWYMTTQYEEEEEEDEDDEDDDEEEEPEKDVGFNEVNGHHENGTSTDTEIDERLLPKLEVDVSLPPPVDSLAHLFPLPGPEIMGNLVLQQCNLWMGNGKSGKSSGLHHDFHDNLYMLLSGRKRFLIWPPLAHRWLEPVGKVDTVHSNGLIEYEVPGQMPLQADGLTRAESAKWLFRARLRALLVADERAARLTGEEHVEKGLRKGKGKQTAEQEIALLKLRESEVDLYLLQAEGEADEVESELLSTTGSQDTYSDLSDLFDRDEFSSDEDEDTADEKMKDSDSEGSFKLEEVEDDVNVASKDEGNLKKARKSKVKRTQGREADSQDEGEYANAPMKKHRRLSPKLVVPKGHLPGGLRGSLQDLQGDLDSGEDEYADEDEEGAIVYVDQEVFDEDNGEEAIFTSLEMRSRVLARARDMADGRSDEEETRDEADEQDHLQNTIGRQSLGQDLGIGPNIDTEEDESWPDMDADALDEGEAALEELARLQNEKEGATHKTKKSPSIDDPKSFSRIEPKLLQWFFDRPFDPGAPEKPVLGPTRENKTYLAPREGCPAPMEIHLKAGQMLYLPASWYHEVTSYSDPQEQSGLHMALNYWFHPPTAIRRPTQVVPVQTRGGSKAKSPYPDFSQPYLNTEVWDEIRRCVNKKVDAIRRRAARQQAK